MSFQASLDTIEAKPGKLPCDLRDDAAEKGWFEGGGLRPGVKAGAIVADLEEHPGLGHGQAMPVVALLEGANKQGGDQRSRGGLLLPGARPA